MHNSTWVSYYSEEAQLSAEVVCSFCEFFSEVREWSPCLTFVGLKAMTDGIIFSCCTKGADGIGDQGEWWITVFLLYLQVQMTTYVHLISLHPSQ